MPEYEQIIEGDTKLIVPIARTDSGPGRRMGKVFYNRQMAFNRDVSVMLFASRTLRARRALDAMAATGARAVRVMYEARPELVFQVNDWEEESFHIIERNIALNDLSGCEASNRDLRCLLTESVYDYIDLDPFGTPVPFLHVAIQALRRDGVLALTATDTSPLAGTHSLKCRRRYQARPCRGVFGHEFGLRILIGFVARQAALFDRGVEPLLCFYADHYFRLHLRLKNTAESADAALGRLGYLNWDRDSHERRLLAHDHEGKVCGPYWSGHIQDGEVLSEMRTSSTLAEPERCQRYLDIWREELPLPHFYENNELSSLLHCSPVRMDRLLEELARYGPVSRAHCSPTGFKTEMNFEELKGIYLELSRG